MTYTNDNSFPGIPTPGDFPGGDMFKSVVETVFKPLMNTGKSLLNLHGLVEFTSAKDGSATIRFNLAGFKKEEITVNLDEAAHRLTVKASQADEAGLKLDSFSVKVPLNAYVVAEDLTSSYVDGILTVNVASTEGRKEENVSNVKID